MANPGTDQQNEAENGNLSSRQNGWCWVEPYVEDKKAKVLGGCEDNIVVF